MSITFTAAELRAIEDAASRLLSILGHPDRRAWADGVIQAFKPLLGADRVFLGVPDGDGYAAYGSDADMAEAAEVYLAHFRAQDFVLNERRKASGLRAYLLPMLARREEYEHTELWNDYFLKYGLCDASGVSEDMPGFPTPPLLHAYHETPTPGGFDLKHHAMLRLLYPAFRAAAHAAFRFRRRGRQLIDELGRLEVPLLLVDGNGAVLHRTAEFERRVAGTELEPQVLATAAELARRIGSRRRAMPIEDSPVAPVCARIDDAALGPVELDAVPISGEFATRVEEVLVHVKVDRWPPAPAMLRARFGLTQRQAEVAHLLPGGRTNREIGEILFISHHTVRHHLERIFDKLGVHTRKEAARRIMEAD